MFGIHQIKKSTMETGWKFSLNNKKFYLYFMRDQERFGFSVFTVKGGQKCAFDRCLWSVRYQFLVLRCITVTLSSEFFSFPRFFLQFKETSSVFFAHLHKNRALSMSLSRKMAF